MCEYGDILGGHDCGNLEAVIEQVGMSTLRESMGGTPGAETRIVSFVKMQLWECDKVILPLSTHGELADNGRLCMETNRKLKLHSGVNSYS